MNDEIRDQSKSIVEHRYNKLSDNFKLEFQREFNKAEPASFAPEMDKAMSVLLNKFYSAFKKDEKELFVGFDSPLDIVEEILLEVINS